MQSELKTHSIETTVSKLIKIDQKAMEVPDFFRTYGGRRHLLRMALLQRFGARGDGAPGAVQK